MVVKVDAGPVAVAHISLNGAGSAASRTNKLKLSTTPRHCLPSVYQSCSFWVWSLSWSLTDIWNIQYMNKKKKKKMKQTFEAVLSHSQRWLSCFNWADWKCCKIFISCWTPEQHRDISNKYSHFSFSWTGNRAKPVTLFYNVRMWDNGYKSAAISYLTCKSRLHNTTKPLIFGS